jgi:hypothetical protein
MLTCGRRRADTPCVGLPTAMAGRTPVCSGSGQTTASRFPQVPCLDRPRTGPRLPTNITREHFPALTSLSLAAVVHWLEARMHVCSDVLFTINVCIVPSATGKVCLATRSLMH